MELTNRTSLHFHQLRNEPSATERTAPIMTLDAQRIYVAKKNVFHIQGSVFRRLLSSYKITVPLFNSVSFFSALSVISLVYRNQYNFITVVNMATATSVVGTIVGVIAGTFILPMILCVNNSVRHKTLSLCPSRGKKLRDYYAILLKEQHHLSNKIRLTKNEYIQLKSVNINLERLRKNDTVDHNNNGVTIDTNNSEMTPIDNDNEATTPRFHLSDVPSSQQLLYPPFKNDIYHVLKRSQQSAIIGMTITGFVSGMLNVSTSMYTNRHGFDPISGTLSFILGAISGANFGLVPGMIFGCFYGIVEVAQYRRKSLNQRNQWMCVQLEKRMNGLKAQLLWDNEDEGYMSDLIKQYNHLKRESIVF